MSHTTVTSVPVSFDDAGHGEPALVYLPGWCSTRMSYAAMVGHTARHRRSIAIDWRGHGTSPAPNGDFGWPQRALLRHRVALVRLRTWLHNRIHAIVAGREPGTRRPAGSVAVPSGAAGCPVAVIRSRG